jgi:glycosyltransferase involved in cell wall biosynthesis
MPRLSIIIPTHKRPVTLQRCLDHIEKQTVKDALEVIVVSDGKNPATDTMFKRPLWTFPLHSFTIEKSQQGICRNRGVERASSSLILFIGDDIFLMPDACEKHLAAHAKFQIPNSKFQTNPKYQISNSPSGTKNYEPGTGNSVAVLGHVTWDPAVGITKTMKWLERSGWQFGHGKIAKYRNALLPKDTQHWFTYTSHISLPTDVALAHPFQPSSSLYGWEDIAWGKRLAQAGVKLFFDPDAKALHHHKLTLQDSLKRMKILGASAKITEQAYPSLKLTPTGAKHATYRVFALLPTLRGRHCRAFLEGMRK